MKKSKLILIIIFLPLVIITNQNIPENRDFGGYAISKELYNFILQILPKGKTILELGSGAGTEELIKHYTVYSIEHDHKWLNKYSTNYIYAPIKDGWYSVDAIKKNLPPNYDLILVDGPTGSIGRDGFLKNINLFKTNIPIIFDDVNRKQEYNLMKKTAKFLNREFKINGSSSNKKFGIIFPT